MNLPNEVPTAPLPTCQQPRRCCLQMTAAELALEPECILLCREPDGVETYVRLSDFSRRACAFRLILPFIIKVMTPDQAAVELLAKEMLEAVFPAERAEEVRGAP